MLFTSTDIRVLADLTAGDARASDIGRRTAIDPIIVAHSCERLLAGGVVLVTRDAITSIRGEMVRPPTYALSDYGRDVLRNVQDARQRKRSRARHPSFAVPERELEENRRRSQAMVDGITAGHPVDAA